MKTQFTLLAALALTLLVGTRQLTAQISLTASVVTQPCNNNGAVSVTVTGLVPPINYVYTNIYSGQSFANPGVNSLTHVQSGLPAHQKVNAWINPNIWTISASNGFQTTTSSFILTPPFLDSINIAPGICPASNTLSAINFTGGTAPFSVIWTKLQGGATYSSNPALVPNGNYSVMITDAAGCFVTSTQGPSVGINATAISNVLASITGTPANCTNGALNVTPGGGTAPYTFLWSNSAVTQNLTGLAQGFYSCTVTDAIGCQAVATYYLQQTTFIGYNSSITNATCIQNNGSIMSFVSGGTAPYTFLWSNGATTQNLTGLVAGQYSVQITDANSCTGTGWATVNANTPVNVTFNASPSSCTLANGSATVFPTGGVAPYSVAWNTFPSSTGSVVSGLAPGLYQFTVTAANGCARTGYVVIQPNTNLSASIFAPTAICPASSGNVAAFASGSNTPFSYQWNNNATTSSLTAVPFGVYTCTITDAVGCKVIKSAVLTFSSNVTVGYSATVATCAFSSNGAVTANATGGTAPYTYTWNTSQTGQTLNGLSPGIYYATATDANGCVSNSGSWAFVGYNSANTSCYCTVAGVVFNDVNGNCTQDAGENGIGGIQIYCSGVGFVFTNTNGGYSFMVPSGTYSIAQSPNPLYPLAACQSGTQITTVVAASGCTTTVNFANTIIPFHDLRIVTSNMNLPIPGNTYVQKVMVFNDGSITQNNIKIGYKHDGQLNYGGSSNWSMIQQNSIAAPNWLSITSGFPVLNAGANSATNLTYNVPTNIPIGTQLNFNDTVARQAPISTSWLLDVTAWNNVQQHQAIVVGSYDPNFKEVFPAGEGAQGDITKNDSILTYVVHFQNTGTYYAQNVVVLDTIDAGLEIASLRPGYSDHKYSATISDNRVLKFSFENIKLPWKKEFGDIASSGMFTYSIKLKRNLPLGTQIKNKAAIYFDYNAPIITNTTLNTLVKPSGIAQAAKESRLLLFPNPAAQEVDVLFESATEDKGTVRLLDLQGKEVGRADAIFRAGQNSYRADISGLENGIYFVQVNTAGKSVTVKLIVAQ